MMGSESMDLDKVKLFLAGHSLPALKDKSAVLVIGPMGFGKSTTIAIQQGAIFEKNQEGRGFELVHSDVYTPKTSAGFTSMTLNVGAYEDTESGLLYLDTAGLDEDRGDEEKLWTKSSLHFVFTLLREIKAILVMVDYSAALDGGRGKALADLAEEIYKVTVGEQIFYDSMIFVVTKAYKHGAALTSEDVVKDAKRMLSEYEKKEKNEHDRLARLYPVSHTSKVVKSMLDGISRITGAGESGRVLFDASKVSERDLEKLHKLAATKLFLETFVKQDKNLIISYPNGIKKCQALRRKVNLAINSAQPIGKDILNSVKEEKIEDNRLQLLNLLARTASNFHASLSLRVSLTNKFCEALDKKSSVLKAISYDWVLARETLLEQKLRRIKPIQDEIRDKDCERKRLMTSDSRIVHKDEHIVESASGFWWWWLWRTNNLQSTYRYNGIPFTHYDLSGQYSRACEKFNQQTEGQLEIEFTADHRSSLNVRVKVFAREKDLPATKERVSKLHGDILEREKQLKELEEKELSLKTSKCEGDLVRIVNNGDIEKRLISVVNGFLSILPPYEGESSTSTVWDSVRGLESLLLLVRDITPKFHSDISEASLKNIEEFLESCRILSRLESNEHMLKWYPSLVESQASPNGKQNESVAPVRLGTSKKSTNSEIQTSSSTVSTEEAAARSADVLNSKNLVGISIRVKEAVAKYLTGDFKAAKDAYERLCEDQPENIEARIGYAKTLIELSNKSTQPRQKFKRLESARKQLERADALDNDGDYQVCRAAPDALRPS